ncbi:diguanylate cyclase [Candidatus Sumerlaeota bacterium]|nr:diguanylate cyclase [Candidatus Sumerlaeota bacterium]
MRRNAKILIVDDNRPFCETLSESLELKGYGTRYVPMGRLALDLISTESFSTALIDLSLPDMDGVTLMKQGKKISPELECIVLTGNASLPTAIEAMNLGAYSYLQKPCRTEQILFTVQRAVEKYETSRNLRLSELKMALAIESSDAGYFEHNSDFTQGAISSHWASNLGFEKNDSLPIGDMFQWWRNRIHPNDRTQVMKSYHDLVNGDSDRFKIEFRIYDKKDRLRWMQLSSRVVERDNRNKDLLIVGIQMDITEQKEAQRKLAFMATHDELTGLPNRNLFMDHLKSALARSQRTRRKLAVLFLDLDKFKDVNDTLGHSIGDELIKMVGEQLCHCLRKSDIIARMGGDEFMLLLPEINQDQDMENVARKIIDMIQIPFSIGRHLLRVTASIGIAVYPDDGDDAETLIKNADIAMYYAKDVSRNTFMRYQFAMTHHCSDFRLWKMDNSKGKVDS